MPPHLKLRVKHATQEAIFRTAQTRFQEEADRHCGGAGIDLAALRSLRLIRAEWCLLGNLNHCSYIAAQLLYSDGVRQTYRWRVPYTARSTPRGENPKLPIQQVTIDRCTFVDYAPGARAGSGRRSAGARRSPSASRPSVGRARRRRA